MPYEIISRIGRGGMGVVDLAQDEAGNRVALKRLSLHGTPEELTKARLRIRREAEVLQQLQHPGVVRLREVIDEDDDLILVMDFLPGGNLAQRVAEHGPLPADEVERLADHLLDALAAAHRQGIVHRDIKPANVLFDDQGDPHLADFGVAVHRDATPGLTATEMVVGTPGFMSPEQARGEDATAASDVFCLGATLLFAATGAGPFGAGDPRLLLMRAAAGRTEKAPKTLPPELRRRIDAMLAKDPAARPSAAEARGGTDGTEPRTVVRRAWAARNSRALVGGTALVLLLMGGAAFVLVGGDGNSAAPRTTPTTAPATTTSTTAPCTPLPFQPCGEQPAPNTDGKACLEGFADYDGDAANGCEAKADDLGTDSPLDGELVANLVPANDSDTYLLKVGDGIQLTCDGALHVTLTAPKGVSQRVTVFDGSGTLGTAVSGDGEPATVTIGDPNCFFDDATTLRVQVESVGTDRSPADYTLTATGSF
ncbi:serine/threonine-protein kinase [Aquihabitans sp. McL0605]|uniref:serine/threonine-protein kinase n=1 Tax=Aquihabitans sp. McL0605 TaxID=3415671 RepID=UPI003CEF0237